jgi:hypothetical protein
MKGRCKPPALKGCFTFFKKVALLFLKKYPDAPNSTGAGARMNESAWLGFFQIRERSVGNSLFIKADFPQKLVSGIKHGFSFFVSFHLLEIRQPHRKFLHDDFFL